MKPCPNCERPGLKRPAPSIVYCGYCGWKREHGIVVYAGRDAESRVAASR